MHARTSKIKREKTNIFFVSSVNGCLEGFSEACAALQNFHSEHKEVLEV